VSPTAEVKESSISGVLLKHIGKIFAEIQEQTCMVGVTSPFRVPIFGILPMLVHSRYPQNTSL